MEEKLLLGSGDFSRKNKENNEKKSAACICSGEMGLSLLGELVKDPGEGRNPDMSDWKLR